MAQLFICILAFFVTVSVAEHAPEICSDTDGACGEKMVANAMIQKKTESAKKTWVDATTNAQLAISKKNNLASSRQNSSSEQTSESNITQNYWTNGWMTNNPDKFVQRGPQCRECPAGQFVQSIKFKEQGGYGIVDMQFKCGEDASQIWSLEWQEKFTHNPDGHWNDEIFARHMDNGAGDGFWDFFAYEEGGFGVINTLVSTGCANPGFSDYKEDGCPNTRAECIDDSTWPEKRGCYASAGADDFTYRKGKDNPKPNPPQNREAGYCFISNKNRDYIQYEKNYLTIMDTLKEQGKMIATKKIYQGEPLLYPYTTNRGRRWDRFDPPFSLDEQNGQYSNPKTGRITGFCAAEQNDHGIVDIQVKRANENNPGCCSEDCLEVDIGSFEPEACKDVSIFGRKWADSGNDDCEKYEKNNWCEKYGDGYESDGHTANSACCACGGGGDVNKKKCVHVDACELTCWEHAGNYGMRLNSDHRGAKDMFRITVEGDAENRQVCAERLDNDGGGWGMQLKISCKHGKSLEEAPLNSWNPSNADNYCSWKKMQEECESGVASWLCQGMPCELNKYCQSYR